MTLASILNMRIAYLFFTFLAIGQVFASEIPPRAEGVQVSADAGKINEPRLMKGTDTVLGTPKGGPRLDGPATSFKFEDAPIVDVVHLVMRDIMKVDYIIHPPINGAVTLATKAEVSQDQAVLLLESALQANGILMVRDPRGVYHIGRPDVLKGIVSATRQAVGGPLPPGHGAIVVPLAYIGAAEMATILKPLMPPEALVRVDVLRNLLVMVGTRTQAEGWLDMVSTFDVDLLKGMSVGVFPLKHASVGEVQAALRLLAGGGAPAAPTNQPGAPTQTSGVVAPVTDVNPFLGAIRVLPIERINSVLVVTPRAAYLEQAKEWIERLDRPSSGGSEPQLNVYTVQNGSAKHLASVLGSLYGQGTGNSGQISNSGVAPGLVQSSIGTQASATSSPFSQAVANNAQANVARTTTQGTGVTSVTTASGLRIIGDEINNAVLVYGTRNEFNKIETTLKRLDLPPTQVLIEASIIEVSLDDSLKYGLQWVFNDSQRTNGALSGTGVLSTASGGALGGAAAGFSYTLANPLGNIRAVLNALADKSLVNVISSPSLMVLDNHTASIAVGNQQPIQAAQTITTGGIVSSSIQYKDTGVSLAVTPSVNAGNLVTMQINQTVTDVGAIDTATGQRSFLQRNIASKVAVRSGEALVLGGLIKDNTTSGKSGVPLLQDLPLIGNLFGTNSKNSARTELLVVITPKVVRTDQDVREISSDLRERMKALSVLDSLGRPVVPSVQKVQ